MTVRTKRLFGPTQITNANLTLYTCPAGKTALVKLITCAAEGAANSELRVLINAAATSARVVRKPVTATDSLHLWTFIVLGPGDTLRGNLSTAENYVVSGFGAELEGTAP